MDDDDYLWQMAYRRVSTKYIDWKYEKEIRVIIANFADRSIQVPNEILKEVIFGYKMPQSDIKAISILSADLYPHITRYKAMPNKESFKMDIDELTS